MLLGEAFVHSVQGEGLNADGAVPRTPLDDLREFVGLPDIVSQGQPRREAYFMGRANDLRANRLQSDDESFRFDSLQQRGDSLHIDYGGGADWATIYWLPMVNSNSIGGGSAHLDFSRFRKLHLDEFAPTDLSRLHVVLGLLFYPGEESRAFSVRNARFQR